MHLVKWTKVYREELQPEWVHLFYHTLGTIPMNWYTEMELRHGMNEWDILREGFLLAFTFEDHLWDTVDDALQVVKVAIFKTPQEPREVLQSGSATELNCALGCYNINFDDDGEDQRKVNIPETEGYHEF